MEKLRVGLSGLWKMLCTGAGGLVRDEDGVTVVEIILILVVLISLVVIFKKQLTSIVKDILSKAARDAKSV